MNELLKLAGYSYRIGDPYVIYNTAVSMSGNELIWLVNPKKNVTWTYDPRLSQYIYYSSYKFSKSIPGTFMTNSQGQLTIKANT